jgi:deoxycytidine triphosphate deaminase
VTDYSMLLARSLIDRAGAFAAYVRAVESRTTRTDDSFAICLRLFQGYADVFQRQVTIDANRIHDVHKRHDALTGLALTFLEREAYFDQYFARGSHKDVSRALLTMVTRELKSHGLEENLPVLTVGPPDNYEVGPQVLTGSPRFDLFNYLFGNFYALTDPSEERHLRSLSDYRPVSILSVPYMEGAQAIWHPIVLGHEIAHMRLNSDSTKFMVEIQTNDWIDEFEAELLVLFESYNQRREGQAPNRDLETPLQIRAILKNWVQEIACDLNAVRLFGPAGLTSIAQFLSAAGRRAEEPRKSHPPLQVRVRAMLQLLSSGGNDVLPPYAEAWKGYLLGAPTRSDADDRSDQPNAVSGLVAQYLSSLISNKFDAISAHVLSWGRPYRSRDRSAETAWLQREFLDGLPGATYCPEETRNDGSILPADILNAAWGARAVVDEVLSKGEGGLHDEGAAGSGHGSPPSAPAGESALLLYAPHLSLGQKRRRVDRLAAKALDSYDFALMFQAGGRNLKRYWFTETVPPAEENGAVLSGKLIERRLSIRNNRRIVISPLFEEDMQDSGVDLRLAPEFIAFRHSRTPVYDPLEEHFDPRTTQESVHVAWGEPFILHPGELVLAATLQYIAVPHDLTAQVITRSSFGRLGLITATAVGVQPGSRNCITLELVNHGRTPIALYPGARVAELVFFTIADPEEQPQPGTYAFATGPEFSMVHQDSDANALRHLGVTTAPRFHDGRRLFVSEVVQDDGASFSFVTDDFEIFSIAEQILSSLRVSSESRLVSSRDVAEEPTRSEGTQPLSASRLVESLGSVPDPVWYLLAGIAIFGKLIDFYVRLSRSAFTGVVIDASGDKLDCWTDSKLPKGVVLVKSQSGTDLVDLTRLGGEELGKIVARHLPGQARDD